MRAAVAAAVALWLGLPSPGFASTLTPEPSPIVLGRTQEAKLILKLDGPPSRGKLRLTANVGEIGVPKEIGPGTYEVSYVPPSTKFPQMALVSVWRDGLDAAPVEFLQLPLHGVTKVPVTSRPGAEVRARIGPTVFGPEVVSPRGTAEISVVVPPGAKDTVILAKVAGVTTQRTVGLEVPPYNRLAAALNPGAMGRGFTGTARLEVLYDVEGQVDQSRIRVQASAGTVTLQSGTGRRLTYRFDLPPGASQDVIFTIAVEGDPSSRVTLAFPRELEAHPGGLLVGGRLGVVHSFTELWAGRLAADAWAPVDLGGQTFALGLSLGYGSTSRALADGSGNPLAQAHLTLLPAAVRLAYVPFHFGGGASVHLGVGGTATMVHYRAFELAAAGGPRPIAELTRTTYGGLFFAGASWNMGPGQAFAELTATFAAVDDPSFRVQAGGLGLEIGYRVNLFDP